MAIGEEKDGRQAIRNTPTTNISAKNPKLEAVSANTKASSVRCRSYMLYVTVNEISTQSIGIYATLNVLHPFQWPAASRRPLRRLPPRTILSLSSTRTTSFHPCTFFYPASPSSAYPHFKNSISSNFCIPPFLPLRSHLGSSVLHASFSAHPVSCVRSNFDAGRKARRVLRLK